MINNKLVVYILLFFLVMGTIASFASALTYQTHSLNLATDYVGVANLSAMYFITNTSLPNGTMLIGITKQNGAPDITATLRASDCLTILAVNNTWVSNNVTVNYTLASNTTYCVGLNASTYTAKYKTGNSYPIQNSFLRWNGTFFQTDNDTIPGAAWNIVGLSLLIPSNINLTILQPNSSISQLTNITFQTNSSFSYWPKSYCYYNITRGASLEVSNTEIVGCTNTTYFNVSGDATYSANFWANDSDGNAAMVSQSFTVSTSSAGTSGGSSSGGGGGLIASLTEERKIGKLCEPYKADFKKAWQEAKQANYSSESLINLWNAYWNSGICGSVSSIVPL